MYTLETLLKESDIITLHVQLSDETCHMIGEQEIAMMRQGALLINTSRQKIVDKNALVVSLNKGHLGGYADDFLIDGVIPCSETVILLIAIKSATLL